MAGNRQRAEMAVPHSYAAVMRALAASPPLTTAEVDGLKSVLCIFGGERLSEIDPDNDLPCAAAIGFWSNMRRR